VGIELWLPIGILLLVIIVIEGSIILRKNKSHKKSSEKFNQTNISMHRQKDEAPIAYMSSEKSRQLRENEEQIKKKGAEDTKKIGGRDEIKVENQKVSSVIFQDGIGAGEVRRGEKEQFNIRKDEENMMKPDENEKWWI